MTPGTRPPLWCVPAWGAVAASLWVAVVFARGRGLSFHELAAGGAVLCVILPAALYAALDVQDRIAARRRWRRPAARRRGRPRLTDRARR